jgi:hypothetical protein
MNVKWSVHPDNVGHKDFSRCFRCHDGNRTSAAGKTITHDCNACHTIIVQGSGGKPGTITPAPRGEIGCNACHTRALSG